jgi:nucleoid-associated protein YgaU
LPEAPPGRGETGLHHVVEGDNLWTIARDRLAKVTRQPASELSEREIGRYWLDVVDANRASLRSGDPDLIFPGEMIKLPPVTRHEP